MILNFFLALAFVVMIPSKGYALLPSGGLSPEEVATLDHYKQGLAFLNRIGLGEQSPLNPPTFLRKRLFQATQQCFPNNPKARQWVKQMLQLGYPAVWTVFFVQDFRNSDLSKKIKNQYNLESPKRQKTLKKYFSELIGDRMIYQLMFESSFRPILFTNTNSANEDVNKCKKNYTSQSQWDDFIIDPKDNLPKIKVSHWECDQPQLYYFQYYAKQDRKKKTKLSSKHWQKTHYRTQDGSFAFYLGNKGSWALAPYGGSRLLKEQPSTGIAGLMDPRFEKRLKEEDLFEKKYYCSKQKNCAEHQLRKNYRFPEKAGIECLQIFFTGSNEYLKTMATKQEATRQHSPDTKRPLQTR